MHGFIGEFLGTFVLLAFGVGTGAEISLKKTLGRGEDWIFVTFSWGLAIALGVYVAGSFGSDGHLNPAVTLAFAMFNGFPWKDVLPYIAGQFLGAFCGATMAAIHYWPQFKATKTAEEGNNIGVFATGATINNPLFNFLNEVGDTFLLTFVLLNLGNFTTGLKPIVVGFLIMVIGQAFGGTTGFAMNPARDWGPRLAYTILPIPNKGDANWSYAWIPMVGPIVGAILATWLHGLLHLL
ncbi:MIP/aquaporin family protein [Lactobacillus corticis]|uniref:Glycerol uptake facilitator protein n=1 Tax=Lactobacillus corticis TaxID=2201249 RepID=A0A916QHF1_9LACO|nr:MIP/aquaporin family protein [Lactobacillus corticis]GFZ26303.1 glycerol uptake facilitator protein [Lactobacillus corticis]